MSLRNDEPLAIEVKSGESFIPYYYHADGLGSITAISDAAGNIAQRYEYDTFGNPTITTHGNIVQPYTFTGREYDTETGMYFYRARYYDPKVGRFVTKDPIGFEGGINPYSYVQNNPINFVDPLGFAGCGPFGMSISDPWGLNECCDKHDDCYSKCEEKKKCDDNFCACMKNKCSKLPPKDQEKCNCRASFYCSAVKRGGGISYFPACGSFN